MQLFNGDCLEVMKDIPDNSVDLVLTSPPYDNLRDYNGSLVWNEDVWKGVISELYRIAKKGSCVVWIVADATVNGSETGSSFKQALHFMNTGFRLHDTMIWNKSNPMPMNHRRYEQSFEYMFVFSKDSPSHVNKIVTECKYAGKKNTGTQRHDLKSLTKKHGFGKPIKKTKPIGNVWRFSTSGRGDHPAAFPLSLAKDHLTTWTKEKSTVLDPFMGSGTTGVACVNTNREFIGIELDKEYFEIAKNRIEDAQKSKSEQLDLAV